MSNKMKVIGKLPPMRTSEDVVNRIQHDECIDKNLIIVGYLDRFLGVIEKKFTAFVWCKVEMASYLDLAIPKHRIEYFKYHGEIVWSKKDRIDKVFGSSKSGNETILDVIERHAAAIDEEKGTKILNEVDDAGLRETNRHEPLRPTHFICIPFTNSSIQKNVQIIQRDICEKASRLGMNAVGLESEGCIPLSALHITLIMIYCPTPESILHAKRVFDSFRDLLNLYIPRHLLITLHGVTSFDERVVYSPPVEIGRLTKLVADMKIRLKHGGVRLVGNHDPYSPHLTLVKLNRKLSKTLNFDGSIGKLPRSLFESKEHDIIGQQACESIQLCELYSSKDIYTGFYRCIASLVNIPHAPLKFVYDTLPPTELLTGLFPHQSLMNDEIHNLANFEGNLFVILMRGLPGHGKSTFGKKLRFAWDKLWHSTFPEGSNGISFTISADDYMIGSQGEYHFDPSLLNQCHQKCLEKFGNILDAHHAQEESRPTLIIIDNTNIVQEEYFQYQSLSRQFGAKFVVLEMDISFLNHEGQGSYPLLSCGKALHLSSTFGVHNVPNRTLQRMWSRWIPDADAVTVIRNQSGDQNLFNNHFSIPRTSITCCQYIGVILDEESRQRLLQVYPPSFSSVRAHHITLCHANETNEMSSQFPLGTVCHVAVFAEIKDLHCQGIVIEVTATNSHDTSPFQGHITVSHDPSVSPKYTKHLLESRSSCETVEYNIRPDHDPLVLRGVVSACLFKDKKVDYCANAVDFWNISQDLLYIDKSETQSAITSKYQIDSIPKDVKVLYIFDLDDTLFHTPTSERYNTLFGTSWRKPKKSIGGWFCHSDSLSLSYPYPACDGLIELLNRVGEIDSAIVVLTGRPKQLESDLYNLLGSRNLLHAVSSIICKSTVQENTTDFKANFLLDICRHRDQLRRVEVWDDKEENLMAMTDILSRSKIFHIAFTSHRVSPFADKNSFSDAVIQWAEENNAVLSRQQLESRNQAIKYIQLCWNNIIEEFGGPIDDECQLTHIFGSYVYERTSDIDMVIIVPRDILGSVALTSQWMKVLESKLLNCGKRYEFRISCYRGTSGTVPKMSLQFMFQGFPVCDVDLIGLICDSVKQLTSSIPLRQALDWTVEELNMHYQCSSSRLTMGDYNILYGLSVRNICVSKILQSGMTLRHFGCLLSAGRRLMDRAFAMGTIRCGMRPYLLAVTLTEVISREGFHGSLSKVLSSWIGWHVHSSHEGIGALKSIYQGGMVADSHLHRILHCFNVIHQSLSKDSFSESSIYECLNLLNLPNQNEYQSVSIKIVSPTLNPISDSELYSSKNVLYGILSKYFGRMIRDGHDVISCPTCYRGKDEENSAEMKIELASFGISRHSVEVFQHLFPLVCKDFEMVHRSRKLSLEVLS